MKKILIIGGGIAGLSCGVQLIKNGFQIEIVESSQKLGGRTYSVRSPRSNNTMDNGQHFLMGCYENTLKYIDDINARNNFHFQDGLSVAFQKPGGNTYKLNTAERFYPFNLLFSFLNFKLLTTAQRSEIIKFLFRLRSIKSGLDSDISVKVLMQNNNQSAETIDHFWEMLVVSAMNTSIDQASSKIFLDMIDIIFFSGMDSSNLVIPKVGLSEALVDPAEKFILEKDGTISINEKVQHINFDNDQIKSVTSNKRVIKDFDAVVSAVTSDSLGSLLPDRIKNQLQIPELKYSPILSVNLWLSKNKLTEEFYNLVGSRFDWIFNKGEYVSLLKSASEDLINLSSEELIQVADSELRKYFPILNNVENVESKVIKERKATFVSDLYSVFTRRKIDQNFNNFFIAGDWINTGLPSTIESAVKSGAMISKLITSHTKKTSRNNY